MKTMKNRHGSHAASRGTISIFNRYRGSEKSSVTNRAKAKAHGARPKRDSTAPNSKQARKRFSAAKRICKNGRTKRTIASHTPPTKPTKGAFRDRARSDTGMASQIRSPTKPRKPSHQ